MFNFLKKKKKDINTTAIKNFNTAIKVIEDFIYFEDYDKASLAIDEISRKETDAFNKYILTVKESEKQKEFDIFQKKIKLLEKLATKNHKLKEKFEQKNYKKRVKQEIKYIKNKINIHLWKYEFDKIQALLLSLQNTYLNDIDVIDFVSNTKKIVTKKMNDYKKKQEKEIKKDAFLEAQELIWEIKSEKEKERSNLLQETLFQKIKKKILFYPNLKNKLKEKQLLDEINMLLQVEWEKNEAIIKAKLAQSHSWIAKKIAWEKINGFDLFGKTLWVDKISWDSMAFYSWKNQKIFYIWDATWHGIKAWFTISQMSKKFNEIVSKSSFIDIVFQINNILKQDLESGNFITSIFFDIRKEKPYVVSFIWMGHEPMFIYRKKTNTVEKIIPWWLAAWIRLIKDINTLRTKEISFDDGDVLVAYTDGIVEAKDEKWENYYSINRIWEKLWEFAKDERKTSEDIYNMFFNDLKMFTWWKLNYQDDVTILVLKRTKKLDIIDNEIIVDEILQKEWLEKKYKKNIKWKNYEELRAEILRIQKENALKNIVKNLDVLYKTAELPKLKQECIRAIKEWYIHKKINNYLKYTIDNENFFKIKQKEQKMRDKYNILKELYAKWDYETVIIECSNIINKDWNL